MTEMFAVLPLRPVTRRLRRAGNRGARAGPNPNLSVKTSTSGQVVPVGDRGIANRPV